MVLSPRRLLNALWRFMTMNATAEQRADMEQALANAATVTELRPRPQAPAVPEPTRPTADADHVPGLAPRHIRPPSWWRGDRAAYRNSVNAGEELGEPAARLAKVV